MVVGGREQIPKALEVGAFSAQVEKLALARTNLYLNIDTKIYNIGKIYPEAHQGKHTLEKNCLDLNSTAHI